jgi:hypothetical protein
MVPRHTTHHPLRRIHPHHPGPPHMPPLGHPRASDSQPLHRCSRCGLHTHRARRMQSHRREELCFHSAGAVPWGACHNNPARHERPGHWVDVLQRELTRILRLALVDVKCTCHVPASCSTCNMQPPVQPAICSLLFNLQYAQPPPASCSTCNMQPPVQPAICTAPTCLLFNLQYAAPTPT